MGKFIFILNLLFIFKYGSSQDFTFPLYFEDGVGYKDTIYFGVDNSASSRIDDDIGEVNIIGQPYDSAFFVFFTNAISHINRCFSSGDTLFASFITKKQSINLFHNPDQENAAEIGMIVKHWPLRISWDQQNFKNFNIEQYTGHTNFLLQMTSKYPFNSNDVNCCGGIWPDNYVSMSDTSEIIYNVNYDFCQYTTSFSNYNICGLFIGPVSLEMSMPDLPLDQFKCWYNQNQKSVIIHTSTDPNPLQVEMFNILGLKVLDKKLVNINNNQVKINISDFPNGFYIIVVNEFKHNFSPFTFKIIKR